VTLSSSLVLDLQASGHIGLALKAEAMLATFMATQREHLAHLKRLMQTK
jgi:hypothetical protein